MANPVLAAKMREGVARAIAEMGSTVSVKLRSGETFTVPGALGRRGQGEKVRELTEGLTATDVTLRFLPADWQAAAPADRLPERGDTFTVMGRRYGALGAVSRGIAGEVVCYIVFLRG